MQEMTGRQKPIARGLRAARAGTARGAPGMEERQIGRAHV